MGDSWFAHLVDQSSSRQTEAPEATPSKPPEQVGLFLIGVIRSLTREFGADLDTIEKRLVELRRRTVRRKDMRYGRFAARLPPGVLLGIPRYRPGIEKKKVAPFSSSDSTQMRPP